MDIFFFQFFSVPELCRKFKIEYWFQNSQKIPHSPKNSRKIHIASKHHAESKKNIHTAKITPESAHKNQTETKNMKNLHWCLSFFFSFSCTKPN